MSMNIQSVYVALFGRPADALGLAFFNSVTGNGVDLTAIGNLAYTEEYQSRFSGMDNAAIINTLYQSLFNRPVDPTGLDYFATLLASGQVTVNTIALHIANGALNEDKLTFDAKLAVADAFTAEMDTGLEVAVYSGDYTIGTAMAFLAAVDFAHIPTAEEIRIQVQTASNSGGDAAEVTTTGLSAADHFQ